jgi:hypothetical protein
MAYTEVLTSGNPAVTSAEQWEAEVHQEYIGQFKMKFLMGSGPNAVIQVKEDLTKSAGDAITIHYASQQTGGTVRGNAKGIGNEGNMDFYAQRFVIDNTRTLHKVWDVPMTEQRTTFNTLMEVRHALTTKHAETFDDDMVTGLTNTSVGKVRGRYLYGAADSNWNATHATALATIDATNDKLTTSMIGVAKRKAVIKGTGVTEKIRPTRIMNGLQSEEWFVMMAHTYAIRDLVNDDAAFRNNQLLLPPGRNSDSLYFTGSHFKGSWEGVLIYEYDRLPLATNTNSIQTAHNLLMGAQAGAVVWGQRTKFGEEDEDLKHNQIYELHDIRNAVSSGSTNNHKLVRNDGVNTTDHGIVNVFSAAVAD